MERVKFFVLFQLKEKWEVSLRPITLNEELVINGFCFAVKVIFELLSFSTLYLSSTKNSSAATQLHQQRKTHSSS
jgi:hypothetical protein